LRPFSGSASIVRLSTRDDMSDRVTSITGTTSETCTDSETPATDIASSSVVWRFSATSTSVRVTGEKPLSWNFT
jgi:hypothetical protein